MNHWYGRTVLARRVGRELLDQLRWKLPFDGDRDDGTSDGLELE